MFIIDHKALTRIFGDKELKDIANPRVLNLKKTLMFTFSIKNLKGDNSCAPDTLSRYPVMSCSPEGSDVEDDEPICAAMTAATAAAAEDEAGRVVDLQQVGTGRGLPAFAGKCGK